MPDPNDFYLASAASVVELETIQISHPSFSKTYWIVRNSNAGITAMLEDGVTNQFFEYYPLQVTKQGADDTLDQSIQISLGDLGEMIPQEIDRCRAAGTMTTRPTCNYRTYRSDDLTGPLEGPFLFDIPTLALTEKGASLQASAPRLNLNMTGETYRLDRFTPLAAFV